MPSAAALSGVSADRDDPPAKTRAGENSFTQLRPQRLYGADLYFFLLSRLKNEQDAKDVVQEIYLRLLRLGQGELVRNPHAYVYFVASQVLTQFRMRAKAEPGNVRLEAPAQLRPRTDLIRGPMASPSGGWRRHRAPVGSRS